MTFIVVLNIQMLVVKLRSLILSFKGDAQKQMVESGLGPIHDLNYFEVDFFNNNP